MYICKNCGSIFSTPAWNKRKSVCPECGSNSMTEANYCKLCHDYFVPDGTELWDNSEYCPDCIEAAEEQLREAILQLVDPDYIDLLRSEYGDLDYIMSGSEQTKSEGENV
jgi:predicted  nucleic acid-binding Zn-ribbon protein